MKLLSDVPASTVQDTAVDERALGAQVDVARPLSNLRGVTPDADELLTLAQVERRTGVDGGRLRTWDRRFSMNLRVAGPGGRPMVRASDVAMIFAIRQLVNTGVRVGEAVAQIRREGPPLPTTSELAQFAALATPVVAFAGPLPARAVWANRAALTAYGWTEASQIAPPPGAISDTVRRLLTAPRDAAAVVGHSGWAAEPQDELRRALAWRIVHPGGAPLALVIDLPAEAAEESSRAEPEPNVAPPQRSGSLRAQVAALASARRALQRDCGIPSVTAAAGLLAEGFGATDACLALGAGPHLRTCKGARGTVYRAVVSAADESWLIASQAGEGAWLSARAARELGASGQHVLTLAMTVGRRRVGFVLLSFTERPLLDKQAGELLASFATAAAAAIQRDHVVSIARRRASEAIGFQLALEDR